MPINHAGLIVRASVSLILSAGLSVAQTASTPASDTAAAPNGGELVAKNCFQCHTDTMFRDQRQDTRAWKATVYRMVGRGGLWTQDEIDAMAGYLRAAFGPDVKPASAQSR
jgi:mono/diheme cytochrome c family protein